MHGFVPVISTKSSEPSGRSVPSIGRRLGRPFRLRHVLPKPTFSCLGASLNRDVDNLGHGPFSNRSSVHRTLQHTTLRFPSNSFSMNWYFMFLRTNLVASMGAPVHATYSRNFLNTKKKYIVQPSTCTAHMNLARKILSNLASTVIEHRARVP